MKNVGKTLVLGLSLTTLGMLAASAQANTTLVPTSVDSHTAPLAVEAQPRPEQPVFSSAANQPAASLEKSVQVASFNTSCADPSPWWTFSGIEAATCLFSGQW